MAILAQGSMQMIEGGISAGFFNALDRNLPIVIAADRTSSPIGHKILVRSDLKDKIKSITTESGAQMREIFQSAQNDREGAMKRIAELRKETTTKVTGLLTADQKATWKEMTGEAYEVKFEPRPAR